MLTRREVTKTQARVPILRTLVKHSPEALRCLDEAEGHLDNALDVINPKDEDDYTADEAFNEACSWLDEAKRIAGVK